MTSSSVAAQIGFERNTIWNPEYIYDRHKPVALDEFISDKEWQTFVHDIDNTLKPAEKFQKGAKIIAFGFMLIYVIIIVGSLTVLKEKKPSIIQLSVLVAMNVLFVIFMLRTENRLRVKARRGLRKVLQQATTTHESLSFSLKQQDRGRKQIFFYLEVAIVMPIAVTGVWEMDDGDVTVNLESMIQSA